MAGKPKLFLVDGHWTTVKEVAAELGLKPQQIYAQMHHKQCGLQAVVTMVRENLILNDQGHAGRHMVNGKWLTVRQAAEMLGCHMNVLYNWIYNHRKPDGSPGALQDAVAAYRAGNIKHKGKARTEYRVGRKTTTQIEAAEALGVDVKTLRGYMHKHRCSLAATIKYYENKKQTKAEKDILAILMEGKS